MPDPKTVRTVFGEKVVGTPDDELRDDTTKFLEFLLALRLDGIGGIRIATTDDSILEVLSEVVLRTDEIGVGEVQEREILRKIVLHDPIRHRRDSNGARNCLPE